MYELAKVGVEGPNPFAPSNNINNPASKRPSDTHAAKRRVNGGAIFSMVSSTVLCFEIFNEAVERFDGTAASARRQGRRRHARPSPADGGKADSTRTSRNRRE